MLVTLRYSVIIFYRQIPLLAICFLNLVIIFGCSTYEHPTEQNNLPSKHSIIAPSTPAFKLPGDDFENWRYIGITDDNQIADEINDPSIKSAGIQIYKYIDRKTIADPKSFKYPSGQPPYKFAIGYWIMDCSNKQYLLNKVTIFNIYGAQIKKYDFPDSKWMKIGFNSISSMQYNYICLNQNKNLGY